MADLMTLARPYARAAFEVARDDKSLPAWSRMLQTLVLVTTDKKVVAALSDPAQTEVQAAELLLALCGDELTMPVSHFVRLLTQNKRTMLLPQIAEQFEHLKAESEKRVEVVVTSAAELSNEIESQLHQSLSKKLGREVELNFLVDSALIGGVVIRYDDVVIDASVHHALGRLEQVLQE